MRSLTIQIPKPCHEHWGDMQPTEHGRFCVSCQKTVVDYTALSDQELVKLLSKAPETSCGRFRNEQLNRQLPLSHPSATSVWRHWVGLLTMSLFGWQTAKAQLNQAPKPSPPTSVRPDFSVSAIPGQAAIAIEEKWVIRGRVMTTDSSGSLLPVLKATVFVFQSGNGLPVQTDSTGSYTLEVVSQRQATLLRVVAYGPGPDHIRGSSTVDIIQSVTSITMDDIILSETMPRHDITGGGITTIKTPSRWQKLKRTLFH